MANQIWQINTTIKLLNNKRYTAARSKTILIFAGALFISLFFYCTSDTNPSDVAVEPPLPYLNLNDTVKYVGMETCRSCHTDKYETFTKTGMGLSFDQATHTKSGATFSQHTTVYDSLNNFYYHPFWQHDSLFIKEYRLEGKDTTHLRLQYIRYIVGSGQHTNSHLYEENGYIYQAPITFYTQKGIWDLAPGFGGGHNSRFNRIIGQECMACHNARSAFVDGSENQFTNIPHGIDCERCHGAGGEHVRRKLAGEVIDTSSQTDFSIVNPRNLPSRDYQMSVCQRCHLQGIAVLQNNKTFDSFKPGMLLRNVMDVYLPEYDGNQTKFIMASQAHRLTKSQCYIKSEMTCLNCHNPHISVKYTPKQQFNNACIKCHQQKTCSLPQTKRQANNNDCSNCHMPPSPSIDIPHVTVHDHFIRKPIPETEKKKIENFVQLANASNPNPSALSQAKGYLHYFESYTSGSTPSLLDSAEHYLDKAKSKHNLLQLLDPTIHLYYLHNNYDKVIETATKVATQNIKEAWTAYRIGEAYWQQKNAPKSAEYFAQAVKLMPLNHDFNNKLAMAYIAQNQFKQAQPILEMVVKENTKHVSALTNLGFVYVNIGNLTEAQKCYQKALALNPDYETTLLNYAALQLLLQNKPAAKNLLQRALKINPNNNQAKAILQSI